MLLNLDGLTESKLLILLSFLESKDIEKLQKDIFENVKNCYKLSFRSLFMTLQIHIFVVKNVQLANLVKNQAV